MARRTKPKPRWTQPLLPLEEREIYPTLLGWCQSGQHSTCPKRADSGVKLRLLCTCRCPHPGARP